jgi:hypothetical protein
MGEAMIRGRFSAAMLAAALTCATSTSNAQNPGDNVGVAASPLSTRLAGLFGTDQALYLTGDPGSFSQPVRTTEYYTANPTAGSASGQSQVRTSQFLAGPTANSGAAPPPSPQAVASPLSPTNSALPAETPWFQRFILPVPEAPQPLDNGLSSSRPGITGNADYLNWSAHRSGLDFASFVSATNAAAATTATQSLSFDRANGFRGGIGYRFGNGWDVGWAYTYFRNANAETVTASPTSDPELIATQSYLETSRVVKLPMRSVEADSTLQMNIQDFEGGWSSCLNDCVGFRAFGGFRWAKINQDFNVVYDYGAGTGTINLPNYMDAEGVRLGAEFEWRSSSGLRVFGRGAQSLMVANFQTRQRETAPATAVNSALNIDVQNNASTVVPVVEAAAGVAFARGPWELRAAFEMGDWFNLIQVNRPAQSLLVDGYFVSLSFSR